MARGRCLWVSAPPWQARTPRPSPAPLASLPPKALREEKGQDESQPQGCSRPRPQHPAGLSGSGRCPVGKGYSRAGTRLNQGLCREGGLVRGWPRPQGAQVKYSDWV